jgi:HEAT repeat protein
VWDDLDEVDWSQLRHEFGPATDVPAVLRACAGAHPDAVYALEDSLVYRGDAVQSAATGALPFLARLAADPGFRRRAFVIRLIADLVEVSTRVQPRFVHDGWPAALDRELPRLLTLLADDDPQVRRESIRLASLLSAEEAAAVLLARWPDETDRIAQRDLVLALGRVAGRAPNDTVTTLFERLLTSGDEQLALAAVHGLAAAGRTDAADHVDLMVRAVTGDVSGWQHSALVEQDRAAAVVDWTGHLMFSNPLACVAYVNGVGRPTSDSDRRLGAAQTAGGLLEQSRLPTAALVPTLTRWLADPVPEIRYRAAYLLGAIGADAVGSADELAAVAEDSSVRASRTSDTVGYAAVWALSRLGDPRAVPSLRRRLDECGGVAEAGVHRTAVPHAPEVPALHEQLAALSQYSVDFLPGLRACLRRAADTGSEPDTWSWTGVATAWGEPAADVVPELIALLGAQTTWWPAARALAQIGPAAADAGGPLSRLAATSGDAAWAFWRITADPSHLLAALRRDLRPGRPFGAIRQAADLGPPAAEYLPFFQEVTTTDDEWSQVEAARACWTTAADARTAGPVLTEIAQRLTTHGHRPPRVTALRYLALLGPVAAPAVPLAERVLAATNRFAGEGGWRRFIEDEETISAARSLVRLGVPAEPNG